MGKLDQLGRYPVHFHNLGDSGAASFATNVSVHDSHQRCFVVHCTDNSVLRGAWGYGGMLGHCMGLAFIVCWAWNL
jgi:hypothetical protein